MQATYCSGNETMGPVSVYSRLWKQGFDEKYKLVTSSMGQRRATVGWNPTMFVVLEHMTSDLIENISPRLFYCPHIKIKLYRIKFSNHI